MTALSEYQSAGRRRAAAAAAILLLGACAPAATAPTPGAAPGGLPPVPSRTGALAIDVVYPAEDAALTASDSNFVFGSVGTGDATLTINGAPVRVAPNGAWLAFVPVPRDGVYRVEAAARGQTAQAVRRVRVPAAAARTAGDRLVVVPGSVSPSGVLTAVRGERVEVQLRATPGARATLVLPDGRRVPLTEQPVIDWQTGFMLDRAEARQDVAAYVGGFALDAPILGTDTAAAPFLTRELGHVERRELRPAPRPATIELVRGADTVRTRLTASIGVLEPAEARVGVTATQRPDSTTIGRQLPGPGQLFQYFFPNGTRLHVTGETAGFYRVRLTDELHVWVPSDDVRLLPPGTPAPRGEVGTIEVRPEARFARVQFSATERIPYHVEVVGEREVRVTFYGATGRTAFMGYGRTDPFVERVRWEQPADDVYRVHLELSEPLWGFAHGWTAGGALELRVRRAPDVDPARPLRGVTVAVDAGHPPGGAIGPTRLTEADANLFVTRRLVPMLEAAGARVVELRPDTATVALIDRPILATRADADLLVSVHYNAFPDGVNPFTRHGTLVLFYWQHSLEFARHLQRELLAELGRPDRGARFQDLALPRTTWMPSVLTETEFLMLPEVEAGARDPAVQERIARAHFRAIESLLREAGARRTAAQRDAVRAR